MLAKFGDERKPPVGWRPFFDACMAHDGKDEAKKYASRITDYEERVECLIAASSLVEAAEAATKAKDGATLERVKALARTPAVRDAVERGLAALGGGK